MKLALTFDDGPNWPYTEELLDILAYHQVHATFFMLGKFVLRLPNIAKQVAQADHWIGNHTLTHPKLTELKPIDVDCEIGICENILKQTVGKHSNMFRPPFILTSPEIEQIVTNNGLKTILFHATGGDATPRGVDFIVDKIHTELDGKSGIILLHDGCHSELYANRNDTVTAVDRIITQYKKEGAEFVSPLEI